MHANSSPRTPTLRHHKATGQGYVVLNGRHLYLGKFGLPETLERYHCTLAAWVADGRQPARDAATMTVAELIAAYWLHAERYYVRPDGTPTGEADTIRLALRPLRTLFGESRAADFGPRALKAVRQRMIELGWSRTNINGQIGRVKRCFRWGVENEFVPATVYQALLAVPGLKRGRSDAKEREPVKPVPEDHIRVVCAGVSRQVRALIALQLLTGARSGELLKLRTADFDTSGNVWLVRLELHKTSYRGRERLLYFGPKAQGIVREFLDANAPMAYLFSPLEAERERYAKAATHRHQPVEPPTTDRKLGGHYTAASYRKAISRACAAAGIPSWNPHRLRHNAATLIRREYGLEAAQLMLGHAKADVTQLYAEVNHLKALEVAERMG